MPTSRRSSPISLPCRTEWRPSRWLAGAIVALGLLGALSVLASEMPRAAAWPLAVFAPGYAARCARRGLAAGPRAIAWPVGGVPACDGAPMRDARLQWRGPLAFLCWREDLGRIRRLQWWPDTLDSAGRHGLRLAALQSRASRPTPSMAG